MRRFGWKPTCVGFNSYAVRAQHMLVLFVWKLSNVVGCFNLYSSVGLPNVLGGHDNTPEGMVLNNQMFFENGLLNVVVNVVDQLLHT